MPGTPRRSRAGIVLAALLAAQVGLAAGAAGAAGPALARPRGTADKVVLTVGTMQDLDSFNLTVGVVVQAFEAWNLHYPTLTGKSPEDFSVTPGLAESWDASDDGLTYTYHLREGVVWSDGEPLTAGDVAYTINRARDEEWSNHFSTVQNITAEAPDDRTVVITSSVPDPKLPVMDVYIVPQHVYEGISADDLPSYQALDDPGGGPFVMKEWKNGEFWRLEANDEYWGGRPTVDEVVFRVFTNADAMVAALKKGEIDATGDVPAEQFETLEADPDISVLAGNQGGFTELSINPGHGLGDVHPALEDVTVRQAIAHAIDKQALIDRVLKGLGEPATSMSPGADPSWDLQLPESEQFAFDLDEANRMLDEAGYADSDDDGVREMPDGTQPLKFRYLARSESAVAPLIAEFIDGWLKEIGIELEIKEYDDTQLTPIIAEGEYEMFVWGWVPFVDPDPMLSYFICDEISPDPESPGYNDANWCSEEYDQLYEQQNQELDLAKRLELEQQMLKIFYDEAAYVVLFKDADLNAFRRDRFTGVVCQPSATGPFLYTNTSDTYANLQPVAAGEKGTGECGDRLAAAGDGGGGDGAAAGDGDGGGGGNTALLIVGALVVVAALGAGIALGRRKPADERE